MTENNPSDTSLWHTLKGGDEKAFQLLFRKHYPLLFLYGHKVTRNRELLEDCIQELFAEIWHNKGSAEVRSVRAYLVKSLQYKIYKKLTQNKTTLPGDDNIPDHPFDITKETLILQNEEDREKAEKIEEMLSHLSNRQREIIYLKYFRNMSYDEISEVLHINYQASRNLLSQALKAMRKLYVLFICGFL